jgi:hypothetical protein
MIKDFFKSIAVALRNLLDGLISLFGKDVPKDDKLLSRIKVLFTMPNAIIASLCILTIVGTLLMGHSVVLVKALVASLLTFVALTVVLLQLSHSTQLKIVGWISKNRILIDIASTCCGIYLLFFCSLGLTVGFIWAYTLMILSIYLIILQKYHKFIINTEADEACQVPA